MSNPPFIHVQVRLHEPARSILAEYTVSPLETLTELFGRVAREYCLDGPPAEWVFFIDGQPLNWANTLAEVSKYAGDPPVLVLALNRSSEAGKKAEGAGGVWDRDAPAPPPLTQYPASPAKSAPSRAAGGGFAGPAPGAAPEPPAAAKPAPKPAAPAPVQTESRRRAPADSVVFGEEMPAKAKRKPAPTQAEFKKGMSGAEDELDTSRTRTPMFDDDEDLLDTPLSRQATVRYYHRMNPQRVYPFLVVLSAEEIAEIVQAGVKQASGERFDVHAESPVEIEPILPGCQVYPPKHSLVIGPETQTLEFWVVPQVLGTVKGAKVIVRQDGETLSEVRLEAAVVKQTAAVVVGAMSFVMPYVTKGLKADNPDGAPYQTALNWVANNLRPEFLFVGLLGLAAALYLWCRPRKRDQFWDVTPKG